MQDLLGRTHNLLFEKEGLRATAHVGKEN